MRFLSSDRGRNGEADASRVLPSACPTCKSAAITTMAKVPNPQSYWRCEACGDVWNGARAQHVAQARVNRW